MLQFIKLRESRDRNSQVDLEKISILTIVNRNKKPI